MNKKLIVLVIFFSVIFSINLVSIACVNTKKRPEVQDLKDKDAQQYETIAYKFEEHGEFENAINEYKKVLKREPENLKIILKLANVYSKQDKYDNAVNIYKSGLKIYPNNLITHIYLIKLFEKLERYDQAIEESIRMYNANPNCKPIGTAGFFLLGDYLQKQLKYDKAIEIYKKLLDIDSNNADGYYELAKMFSLKRNKIESVDYLKKALNLKSSLKDEAKTEEGFEYLKNDNDFKKIINE